MGVLPAHAGMILPTGHGDNRCHCAPRARGDDPSAWVTRFSAAQCSPRTRG